MRTSNGTNRKRHRTQRQKKNVFASCSSMLCFGFVFLVFLIPVFALASNSVNINYTPLAPIPETVTPAGKVTSLGTYLKGIYITGVALAGLFAVFSIVRGGFELLFTDSILGKMEGKKIILRALGGLLIVFSSYLLMNTINPQLGKDLNLNLDLLRRDIQRYTGNVTPVTPEQAYGQELDRLLVALNAENEKRDVIDAKAAERMVLDAAAGIRELNRQISDPSTPASELERLITQRDALVAQRALLLPKTIEADVVAAKARIDTGLAGINYIFDSKNSRALELNRNDIVEILGKMRVTAERDAGRIQSIGFPEKAAEIIAAFESIRKTVCGRMNTELGMKVDCG